TPTTEYYTLSLHDALPICIVIKLALIFGAMIIFLTFFSKTINNTLLPVVDTVKVKKGSIGRTIEKTGQVELLNKENVYATGAWRSEEHTSELQSRRDLVCR